MGYSLERFWRVYDDDTGSYVQIRPDSDGLGLVEVYCKDPGDGEARGFTMPLEQAEKVHQALGEFIKEHERA